MDKHAAFARLRELAAPSLGRELRLEADDFGNALLYTRRDMSHLDADALNDRLHAWSAREVQRGLPHAGALVSFRHARPATHEEAQLDIQEVWLDLEPTFRLELDRPSASEEELRAFVSLIPAFLALLEGRGRPAGWRQIDAGAVE